MGRGAGASREVAAIIVAAGTGERLGRDVPKGFVPLWGEALLVHSVRAAVTSGVVSSLVVAAPSGWEEQARSLVEAADLWTGPLAIVRGGATRQGSVRAGLDAVGPDSPIVLCHDAARPLASAALFRRVLEPVAAGTADGAVPVVASPDTVKRILGDRVVETVPRAEIGLAQTPQAFVAAALRGAHLRGAAPSGATDDAMLLEEAGYRVVVVDGEPANFKVTTEDDLARAEALLRGWAEASSGGPMP